MDERTALARAPIFASLKPSLLDQLARSAKRRQFALGESLVKEGDDATTFYVLCSGDAEVVKGLDGNGGKVIGHLTAGDFFGEMALLDEFPRSASVRATSDCECLVLARWDFVGLIRTSPEVALAVLPVLSKRLRECEDQLLP
jgi:CRP-like cAMP-binding protein